MVLHEQVLILRRQHRCAVPLVRVAEGGEDLPADTEVRVAHVGPFDDLGEAQRQSAELVCGHSAPQLTGGSTRRGGAAFPARSTWALRSAHRWSRSACLAKRSS